MKIEINRLLDYIGDGVFGVGAYDDMKPFCFLQVSLVIATNSKTIVEIGTGTLNSGMAFSYGLNFTGGKLYTCDPNKMFNECPDNVEYFQMTSDDLAKRWKMPIDILFIDGDHHYSQVKRDFENFYPFVRKDGLVLIHDIAILSLCADICRVIEEKQLKGIKINKLPGLFIHQKDKRENG